MAKRIDPALTNLGPRLQEQVTEEMQNAALGRHSPLGDAALYMNEVLVMRSDRLAELQRSYDDLRSVFYKQTAELGEARSRLAGHPAVKAEHWVPIYLMHLGEKDVRRAQEYADEYMRTCLGLRATFRYEPS